ncbi:hypothetical protein Pla22_23160 [Rubripirellula amarantea]|uniref:Uncharacterized protein n=1 Tax=Rubripirellula amarantea TaxID=2527999 RepID=A0A5C5WVH8_9BACT|nr:hypothetical protein [Rubripirellula amarantea]TWT54666.1 hypothetical protein Pla22_23160 [Rubripirellula amarantea]
MSQLDCDTSLARSGKLAATGMDRLQQPTAEGHAIHETKADRRAVPVHEQLDPKNIFFQAQFD